MTRAKLFKIASPLLVIALLCALIIPFTSPASADGTITNVSDTLTNTKTSTAAGHEIKFRIESQLSTGENAKIVVTFASEFSVPDGNLTDYVTVTYDVSSEVSGTATGSSTAKTVTFTLSEGMSAGVEYTMTITEGANIINPAAVGEYTITVETWHYNEVLDAAGSCTVSIVKTDTMQVTGNVTGGSIELTAPSDISLGDMAIGGTYSGNSTDGLVKCSENGWSLTVVDAKETNAGYMVSGENVLSNELQLCDTENGAYQDADTSLTLVSNGTPTGESGRAFGTYVKQQITYDDVVANDYSIILTFTVSVTV